MGICIGHGSGSGQAGDSPGYGTGEVWEVRALVTGATGFVGSHLVEELVAMGHSVRVLVRPTSDMRWIGGLDIECRLGDVIGADSLDKAVEGMDWVFHVAGVTKARGLESYMRANALGTFNVLKACAGRDSPPRRVVVLSSLAAWGPSWPSCPRQETEPCSPVSHYGLSKARAEDLACSFASSIPLVILRPPAVYGPRDRDVLAFFRMVKRGLFVRIGGDERYVCMIHVKDLVQGILLAATAQVPSGSIYSLSDGKVHTWTEVAEIMGQIMGVSVTTVKVPLSLAWVAALVSEVSAALLGLPPLYNREKLREMLQPGWTCSIDRSRAELGFEPRIPLEEGLKETYLWYRDMKWL
jgi:dihydroflavonol-4-reductase